jgi:hypothetical protein
MSDRWSPDDAPGDTAAYQETTTTSWWDRIKGAFAGILIGLICIPGSSILLFWNEGRAVQTARSLAEGAGMVTAAPGSRVDAALDGRLVHVSGDITAAGVLRDAEFSAAAENALRLIRRVEMYQWREESRSETRSRLGGGQETVTTYHYSRVWSADAIDSSRFRQPDGHQNPAMRITSREFVATNARLGAHGLTEQQLRGFGSPRDWTPQPTAIARPGQQVVDGRILIASDPTVPRVGDMRISFMIVEASRASLMARQAGQGFEPYQTRAGDRLFMLREGSRSAEEMFNAAVSENRILTWILRGVGALVMFIGFMLIMRPMVVLADVVPLFGSIIGAGTGIIAALLTFVLAPVVIAVAWFWYRPLVAIIVLAVGAAGAFGMGWLARQRRAARPAMPAGTPPRTGGSAWTNPGAR